MCATAPAFQLRLATDPRDRAAAHRLRYEVFVAELGGDGPLVDHEARREVDRFDAFFDHLILVDPARDAARLDHVVGVYRVMTPEGAARAGQYYTEDEYDISVLRQSGRRLLELGRSCLHPQYRGGTAMMHLWSGLADYATRQGAEILFGVASFHGTDIARLGPSLSVLHHRHLAPPALRVRARSDSFQAMDLIAESDLDRTTAMRGVPALIKGYLRLGGFVGEGAYVDHAFNTTDICLVMDTARMNLRQSAIYTRARA
ncbi:GNAT family N-acetyltransferase [Oceaniglobus indicus]|uniref:GNAT family N-acetyltransferase n=1 Tax=Oceaniglobus indicus TaxID=2047749 RepID=UPI000C1A7769|nr:GNAT family N-acyltransferase [Oceaniglobus indicus]